MGFGNGFVIGQHGGITNIDYDKYVERVSADFKNMKPCAIKRFIENSDLPGDVRNELERRASAKLMGRR